MYSVAFVVSTLARLTVQYCYR